MHTFRPAPARSLALAALVALPVASPLDAQQASTPPARWLDSTRAAAIVAEGREAFAPVGLAVAVVQDGRVTFQGAWGARRAGSGEAVQVTTPFAIASMTKAFTGAALALLVDEKRLAWDDPVVQHLPGFAMADPYVTRHLTVRDLLVHRSGLALGAGDLLTWPDSRWTPDDVMRALPHLPLDHGFRERYVYDNTLYIVAGELVKAVSGQDWATFVQQRLLTPLGMRDCAPRPGLRGEAAQHARSQGAPRPVPVTVWHPDPAGSIVCSVADLTRWARFQLAGGVTPEGTRLLSEAALRETHIGVSPMRPSGLDRRLGRTHLQQYALGWIVSDFHGHQMVAHGGSAPGGATEMLLLPEKQAAVIVLANDQVPVPILIARQLAEAIARDAAPASWIADARARMAARAPARDTTAAPAATGEPPRAPLAAHAGTYRDPWYGDITVRTEAGGLVIHLTRSALLRGPLLPLGGARFLARWPDRSLEADAIVTFAYGADGQPTGFTMQAASPATDFSYDYHHLKPVRVAAAQAAR